MVVVIDASVTTPRDMTLIRGGPHGISDLYE